MQDYLLAGLPIQPCNYCFGHGLTALTETVVPNRECLVYPTFEFRAFSFLSTSSSLDRFSMEAYYQRRSEEHRIIADNALSLGLAPSPLP